MSPLVVYILVITAACAAAGPAVSGKVECYDDKGQLLIPLRVDNLLDCKLWCPPGCPEGRCSRHNQCDCNPGFKDARTPDQVLAKAPVRCEPVCSNDCVNADCVAPETCQCWNMYMKVPGMDNTCVWGD